MYRGERGITNCVVRLKGLLLMVRKSLLLSNYPKVGREQERLRIAGPLQGLRRILYSYRDNVSQRQAIRPVGVWAPRIFNTPREGAEIERLSSTLV